MQGMTDFMWLIDRGDNAKHASLTGRGRDINDFEYAVRWDSDQWRYKFDGNLQMVEMNENRREVIDAMNVLKNEGIEDVHRVIYANIITLVSLPKTVEEYQKPCNEWLMILRFGKAKNMERTHLKTQLVYK